MSAPDMVRTVDHRDVERAAQDWLDDLGMTMIELREEAAKGDFRSDEAALAWFFITSLDLG